MTKSRAGFLALVAECLLYLVLVSKSIIRLLMWVCVSLPFVAGFMMVVMQREAGDLEGSSDSRMCFIISGFKMLKAHPLLGVGVGNYPKFYEQFAVTFIEL